MNLTKWNKIFTEMRKINYQNLFFLKVFPRITVAVNTILSVAFIEFSLIKNVINIRKANLNI